jgi:cyclopropane fatty-acyl-phospholipid synthase-like methyltransferase
MLKKISIYLRNSLFSKIIYFLLYKFKSFESSSSYWENRYQKNGNSGSGSYNESANFKAKVINDFIKNYNIEYVEEFGCGDGNQLTYAMYPNYIGYDVSDNILIKTKSKFQNDTTKQFFNLKEYSKLNSNFELALSLDVIYHLVEDYVFESHMKLLFSGFKYVVIFSTNYDDKFYIGGHVKNRKFTNWIDSNINNYELIKKVKNKDNLSKVHFFIYRKILQVEIY